MADLTLLQDIEVRSADEVVEQVLAVHASRSVCLTCSYQAEDILVLSLLRRRLPRIPVLFLETGYHFRETYEFRDRMTSEWNLNLINAAPGTTVAQQEAELGILYRDDPTRCCQLRKVEPLFRALEPFDLWFTGLRRGASPPRRDLQKTEDHRLPSGKSLLKERPLRECACGDRWGNTQARTA